MTISRVDSGELSTRFDDENIESAERRRKAIDDWIHFHACIVFAPVNWLHENIPKIINWKQHQLEKRDALKCALIDHPDHQYFSRKLADYFKELFIFLGSETLQEVPSFFKPTILYKLGLTVRYIDHKAEKYTKYKKKFARSEIYSEIIKTFNYGCSLSSHYLFGGETVHLILEKLFLQISLKLLNHQPVPGKSQYPAILIHSLAKSLLWHEQIDSEKKIKGLSQEEQIILRLERLKELNVLSAGLPDPTVTPLRKENLHYHLDQAMDELLEKVCDEWLSALITTEKLGGVAKAFYLLEGKDLFNTALRHLLGELVIKAYTDPTTIMQAVVYAFGIETAELEAEGFGKGSLHPIMQTAKELLNKRLNQAPLCQMNAIFAKNMPRYSIGGRAEIYQKQKLKAIFYKLISNLFHRTLKKEKFDFEESNYKAFRNATKKIPVLGELITGIHLIAQGAFESLRAPFQEKPLMQTLFESLSGKDLADHLTRTLMTLIHQPTWRLIAIDVVSELYTHLLEVRGKKSKRLQIPRRELEINCGDITLYFLKRAFPNFTSLMTPYRNSIGKAVYQSIKGDRPKNLQTLTKEIVENALPSIKEETISCRLLNVFRVYGFNQTGDERFWNHYIRELLNRNVEEKLKKGGWRLAPGSQSDLEAYHAHIHSGHALTFQQWEKKSAWWRSRYREKFIDSLLRLNTQELLKRLLSIHIAEDPLCVLSWEFLPLLEAPVSLEEEVKLDRPFELIEDYLKE